MTSETTFNTYGADLEKMLCLRTYPIAIKMLEERIRDPGRSHPAQEETGASTMPSARSSRLRAARE